METSPPIKVHCYKAFDVPLSSVTVYNDRAEVKRTVKVNLEKGVNEVVVQGVSRNTNPDSIRVDGRGEATIHEVQFQCQPALPSESSSPKVQKLKDERKELVERKLTVEDRQKVIQKQIEALDELVKQVSGSVVNPPKTEHSFVLDEVTCGSITKFMEFYETNSVKVRALNREVDAELKKLNEQIEKLDAELERIRADSNNTRNISILLESEKVASVELTVSYQVWDASWVPSYDIRVSTAEDGKALMRVSYYGKIRQNTGEDWNEAKLILSTAQPALGGNVPTLGTLVAKFKRDEYSCMLARSPAYQPTSPSAFGMARFRTDVEMRVGRTCVSNVSAGDTVMSTVFEITRPTSIPADSSEHRVTIALVDLQPSLLHVTVPCRDTNVYLLASLVNETAYPFLAGQAAVYLENSFVAKTDLKSVSAGESFQCSLGVDPAIKVEYKPVHKYTEQVGLLTKSASVAHEQKIVVRNTKKQEVLITVKELIPKSTDDKIKIRLLNPSVVPVVNAEAILVKPAHIPAVGAKLNTQNNLEWTVKLEPNKEAELLVKYAVEHPNSETVVFREAL